MIKTSIRHPPIAIAIGLRFDYSECGSICLSNKHNKHESALTFLLILNMSNTLHAHMRNREKTCTVPHPVAIAIRVLVDAYWIPLREGRSAVKSRHQRTKINSQKSLWTCNASKQHTQKQVQI